MRFFDVIFNVFLLKAVKCAHAFSFQALIELAGSDQALSKVETTILLADSHLTSHSCCHTKGEQDTSHLNYYNINIV